MNRFQQTAHALGSDAILTLLVSDRATADRLFKQLWSDIADFEARFSRFRAESELSHFNQHAGQKLKISPQFRRLLVASQQFSYDTDGLYNPFILPDLQRSGYLGSWPNPTQQLDTPDYRSGKLVSALALEIGKQTAKIPTGAALDFGGIGKGYLLDQLAIYLDQQSTDGYWLSLGGDIICAGHGLDSKPWDIAVAGATQSMVGSFTNNQGQKMAVATSGITKRRGSNWHHLIDPRTGQPAKTDLLTASVKAETATQADVLAKIAVIMGSRAAVSILAKAQIDDYVLQTADGHQISQDQGENQ